MSCFCRVAWISLSDRLRSSSIQERLRIELLLLRIVRSQMWWSEHLHGMSSGHLPGGDVSGMLFLEETLELMDDMLEIIIVAGSAGLGMSWCPLGGAGRSGRGQEHLDVLAETVAPTTCIRITIRKWNKTKQYKVKSNQVKSRNIMEHHRGVVPLISRGRHAIDITTREPNNMTVIAVSGYQNMRTEFKSMLLKDQNPGYAM